MLKKVISVLLFLLLSYAGPPLLVSLNPQKKLTQFKLDTWGFERGFEPNMVDSILQSKDGYLWFGTLSGLIRFDGNQFRQFNKQNTGQLKGNEIRALYQEEDGTLWIGTDGGLNRLKNGILSSFPSRQGADFKTITSIIKTKKGTIMFSCKTGGIGVVRDGAVIPYADTRQLVEDEFFSILEDVDGNLWFGSSGGLNRRTVSGEIISYSKQASLDCRTIYAICQRHNGELWFGTNEGIYQYLGEQKGFKKFGLEAGMPNKHVTCLYEDQHHNIWGGTDGGLIRIRDGIIETLASSDGLSSGFIYSIYEDHEGSLWIGTFDGALHRLRETNLTVFSTKEGLVNDYIHYFQNGGNGVSWVGTKGGVNRLKDGKPTLTLTTDNGLTHNDVTVVVQDNSGALLFATPNGLQQYKEGKLRLFTTKNGLSNNFVKNILINRKGEVWVGTKGGLNQFENGGFKAYGEKDRMSGSNTVALYELHNGDLLIGYLNGKIDRLVRGKFTRFFPHIFKLPSNAINCIYEDKQGVIYIGARTGLFRIQDGKAVQYTTGSGLADNFVNCIMEDHMENLWLGGRTGISCVKKSALVDFDKEKIQIIKPLSYSEKDGMKRLWCHSGARKTADGKLWFPTSKGLVMIDPASIIINSFPPPVIIEEFTVDDESFLDKKEQGNSNNQPIIQVPAGKKQFKFTYTAMSFIKPLKMNFSLKLENFDSHWVEMGNIRSNTYAGLTPGRYRFRVRASNSDGVWNLEGTSLSFYVNPYFYETPWFYIFSTLFAVVLGFSIFRFRIRQLKARERKLSRLVDIRTHALNEQTQQLEKAHVKLSRSNRIIEEKNRHIVDSIQYARKIQHAILPSNERMKCILDDYFILFKPRDIVSGDFYWFSQSRSAGAAQTYHDTAPIDLAKVPADSGSVSTIKNCEKMYLAVVDCTGHGVPGALLSIIGHMKLNDIFDEYFTSPAYLLSELHFGVSHTLRQVREESKSNDGMDIALCMVDVDQGEIIFSGARRPLYYFQNGQLNEIKGSRDSIGDNRKGKEPTFKDYHIDIQPGTKIYLTTDGFADQNNPKNKKYGSVRLKKFLQTIAHLPMEQQKQKLLEEFESHRNGEEQRDDITIIGLKIADVRNINEA